MIGVVIILILMSGILIGMVGTFAEEGSPTPAVLGAILLATLVGAPVGCHIGRDLHCAKYDTYEIHDARIICQSLTPVDEEPSK